MNIEKYNNYIDVQGTWFNKYPRTWNINRLKEILFNSSEQSKSIIQGEKYIELANVEGWTGNIINLNNNPEFESSVKNFKKGNVLFSKLRPYLAKSIIAPFNGVCVSEFLVFKPHLKINNKFLHYVLLSDKFIQTVNNSTYGSKMPRASWDFIKIQMMAYPELIIQNKIAIFLDKKTSLIDKKLSILEDRKKLILELEKSVINQVVTKGLQSFNLDMSGEKIDFNNDKGLSEIKFDAYMSECGYKDSGIEWIGYVNKSFNGSRIKNFITIKKGTKSEQFEKSSSSRLPLLNLDYLRGRNKNYYFSEKNAGENIKKGEILIVWDGAATGEFIIAEEGILSSTIAVLRTKSSDESKFLFYLNYTFNDYLSENFNGMGIPHVNPTIFKNLKINLPSTNDIKKINIFLNKKTSQFKKQVSNIDKEIELLKEFRKTVINDVVTGKIKVVV